MSSVDDIDPSIFVTSSGGGDPIPDDQDEINKQADAAIRDLFPRIPNTDREVIIRHAFQKGAVFNGKPVVGLQKELTLSRRVQLAVIAHIRHTHTRYDLLLRETTWEHARKTVEPLTLDILVKWRGDEETGRDQLDEVLREIVILDDSDDEEGDDDEDEEETEEENTGDELEEGEVSEPEPVVRQKTPTTEFISLISSPLRPASPTQSTVPNKRRLHDPSISSRTRSKTNPKPNFKKTLSKGQAKRARRRQRALQAARDRVNQQSSNQKTAMEVVQQEPGHSTPNMLVNSDYSNLPPDLRNRPYNQSIYAIDDRPQRPRRVSYSLSQICDDTNFPHFDSTEIQQILAPPSQQTVGTSMPIYSEQVIMRPRVDNARTIDQGFGYDPRPRSSAPITVSEAWTAGGYVTSPRRPPVQERVLPSIEKPINLESERSHMRTPSNPGRHSQVMYPHPEPVRGLPVGSNIVYIDDGDRQPKRQRLVLANGESLPIFDDPGDGSFRPIRRQERPPMYSDESSELARVRRLPVAGHRDEELPFISDDGRRLVRVVRRVPVSEPHPRDQIAIQPPAYSSHRAEDQPYASSARPTPSMRESRPIESVQTLRPVLREPSHTFQTTAPDNSNYLSTFPHHSHSRSREMNSGVISYPVSRHVEPESRFLPARHESQVGRSQLSPQFPPDRFPIDHPERGS